MFARDTAAAIAETAAEIGVEPAALLAIAEVESGGRTSARVAGRAEPLIRFEGHYFDRRLPAAKRAAARQAGLAAPRAGAVANPAGQAARWRLLARAAAIDRQAAYESVSWGIGQVMGAHWSWLGYASVEALVAEARSGPAGQVRLMARFIARAGLVPAIRRRDWAAFARRYNGPAYRKNRYDSRLAAAYRRHAATAGGAAPAPGGGAALLRRGDAGAAVRALQVALTAHGHPTAADGVFGPRTEAALRGFQKQAGLAVDGIAGPRTAAALARPAPAARLAARAWAGLRALCAGLVRRLARR
ncbi:N-acetylmuramidase domain-containing protein [Aquibium sp. A9E412]|uniref:N-acetylmuramidase domain-containing protein n=1 Tax=Aquibium sp. A9E412 TaxID=2976767 RepID=UPI0025B0F02D|nr:N-acetylmuramidase domain-containing protein [Aquibium sp. A9E412]MDN2567286.1 N-acetylmuramidase domain-containing protein [Aquibium sp. A9E412]